MKAFDPDEIQKVCDEITPEQFGRLVARVMHDNPTSQNWILVSNAIAQITEWTPEYEQIEAVIERIANTGDE